MITIMRRYILQAAHRLPRVAVGHKCGRLHGHTWDVEVWIGGTPDDRGWFMDFAEIDAAWSRLVHDAIDHSDLNETIENPTTENLCEWIGARLLPELPGLARIVARENSHSAVEWSP